MLTIEQKREKARLWYKKKTDEKVKKVEESLDPNVWKPIPSYEDYKVSVEGIVINKFGKVLKPASVSINGYQHVCLTKKGAKPKHMYVHLAVWRAFNGEIPTGLRVCHISNDVKDNSLANLELLTQKENFNKPNTISTFKASNKNTADKKKNLKKKKVLQYDMKGKLVKKWPSIKSVQEEGFSVNGVSLCCNGKLMTHKGYMWKHAPS